MYRIIAEEADFLVISKSANVHFHSQDGTPGVSATLGKDTGCKLYPVHRLDSVTSGLLLFAKSAEAARSFSLLFSSHQVQKYYLALAKGKPKKKQGWVIGDMAKSRRSQYKLLRSRKNPAVSQFFSTSVIPQLRCYLLKPLSGKTHQLRVAMASLSTPILGDTLYGGEDADRVYLHAWQLEFTYKNKEYAFRAGANEGELFSQPEIATLLEHWSPPSGLAWPDNKLSSQRISKR